MGEWWRWALVSPDGVAPSWMVSMSASVNLPLHHKVQKFSSGAGSPGWSRKEGRKTVVVVVVVKVVIPACCARANISFLQKRSSTSSDTSKTTRNAYQQVDIRANKIYLVFKALLPTEM